MIMNEAEKRRRIQNEAEVLDAITDHPLHSEQIAIQTHISTGEVNAAILSLRSRGIEICGDDAYDGYYYGCPALLKKTVTLLKWQRQLTDMAIGLFERRLKEYERARKNDGEEAR